MKAEDVKAWWPILTLIVLLSGFYYTTQLRLEQLEISVSQIKESTSDVERLESEISSLKRRINKHSHGK